MLLFPNLNFPQFVNSLNFIIRHKFKQRRTDLALVGIYKICKMRTQKKLVAIEQKQQTPADNKYETNPYEC